MKIGNIEISWLGHSGFMIASKDVPSNEGKNSKVIYIDPYNIRVKEKADFIFITHDHYDHCSFADMEKIVKEGTKIIIPAGCQSKIVRFNVPIDIEIIEPGNGYWLRSNGGGEIIIESAL